MDSAIVMVGFCITFLLIIFSTWLLSNIFAKIGCVVSGLAICLGLVYSGFSPLFGGSHSNDTYFGSLILVMGVLGWLHFMADHFESVVKDVKDLE